jgi:hypothetical protein
MLQLSMQRHTPLTHDPSGTAVNTGTGLSVTDCGRDESASEGVPTMLLPGSVICEYRSGATRRAGAALQHIIGMGAVGCTNARLKEAQGRVIDGHLVRKGRLPCRAGAAR